MPEWFSFRIRPWPVGREDTVFKNHTEIQQNKMLFVGDPHGRHAHIVEEIESEKPAACVLVGDQCYGEPIDQLFAPIDGKTAFHWIHGNHDTDQPGWYANLFDSPWAERNLHGRVQSMAGVRVAGLGGVFRGQIWEPDESPVYADRASWKLQHASNKYRQIERKHQSTIWPEDYHALGMQEADILVLHEAPSCHRYGVSALDDLAEVLGVRLIVHGHHHSQYTARLDSGIAVVGLGLAQLATLDLDAFRAANDADDIVAAFDFGMMAKRSGGWLY